MIKIIAEAGVNHNGDFANAKRLVSLAKESGADFVKFQTFKADNVVTKDAVQAPYQITNTGKTESQYEMLKRLELTNEEFVDLDCYCKDSDIQFISTAFDEESIEFLDTCIDQPFFKIASSEITNYFLLKKFAQTRKPVVLSTGMSSLSEIDDAINCLIGFGTSESEITLLHCNTEYPTPADDVNISAIRSLQESFSLPVGYSDHTLGSVAACLAVAYGATIIEKHFTLSKSMVGPDHKASADPNEIRNYILEIRNAEKMIGDGIKQVMRSEKENILIARKSLVARKKIKIGEKFSTDNVTSKRPGNYMSPMLFEKLDGKLAVRDFLPNQPIEFE